MSTNVMKHEYRVCSNCVMDTTDPAITFDERGVCDQCNSFYQKVLPNFHVVHSDVLYRSGQPRGLGLRVMNWLNVRTFFNLRKRESDSINDEIAFCRV